MKLEQMQSPLVWKTSLGGRQSANSAAHESSINLALLIVSNPADKRGRLDSRRIGPIFESPPQKSPTVHSRKTASSAALPSP
jgi:hypothetical protein